MATYGSIYIKGTKTVISLDEATTVPSETHTFDNEVVSQTLENGCQLSDHIIVLQDELEIQLFISNSVPQKSQETYAALKNMRNTRELCQIFTDHEIYRNMAIQSVSAPHEAPYVNQLSMTLKFKRIDYVGSVTNEYPPSKFQENVSVYGQDVSTENLNIQGTQDAILGFFGKKDDIDMAACNFQDAGELSPSGVAE